MASSNADAQTPGASTSSAWVSDRTNERAAALQAYASDPKYKKYLQQVEKCLNSFDNVHEWADCIAFLKQLLKTFQSYMQFKEIPRKLVVAKRLAQCLNPALPTGVHQRALDVYSHILAVLGTEGLKKDLPLWSSGLFPFFEYAATSVKPTLLNLYDTHYLPLQASLRPVMKSFILALLPGLEEETGEFFDKVLSLLDRLSATVSQEFFFQNIWLVMLTTPSARGNSLNFLSRRLPPLNSAADITGIVGKDVGLMIRAFAAALEDDNLLVRRGALDILLQSMRVSSSAIQRATPDDRAILMRAAFSVVLRRDLSLNRRLYTWLLGPDEKADSQLAYLKMHSLDLLRSTLTEDMVTPSGEYSESRPFKIFISLLDKWEIGSPLTDVLVYDAFKAIKRLVESGTDSGDDLIMTASTLYEAVEPQLLWRHLLEAMLQNITGDGLQFEALKMTAFIIETFSQDEEIRTIQLPVIFSAIIDILTIQLQQNPRNCTLPSIRESFVLLEIILQQITHVALMRRPQMSSESSETSHSQRPYHYANTLFNLDAQISAPAAEEVDYTVPFTTAFEQLCLLSTTFARILTQGCDKTSVLREIFSICLHLLNQMVLRLASPITVSWEPTEWLSVLMDCLEHDTANFTLVDRIVSLAVVLHQTPHLTPGLSIDSRPTMYKTVTRLLQYLRPNFAAFHVRTVSILWSLESVVQNPHVESIITQSMTSPESRNVAEAYEAFGVLWRLTDDNLLPGFQFKVPLMIVLDTLKHDDPNLRRIGETWMRCSLKSYLRVLDPILFDLLDPGIKRTHTVLKVKGKEIPSYSYDLQFDQRYCNHLLSLLLSISKFGGQGFAKTARNASIKRSYHYGLVNRVNSGGFPGNETSYLDVLVELLLRLLQSEPPQKWATSMNPYNSLIQCCSVDLLQGIVSRGEVDSITVQDIEAAVVGKLYFCVHTGRLDLQNKLLHLLHSVVSASTPVQEPRSSAIFRQKAEEGPITSPDISLEIDSGYTLNPLLVQTLVDGISTASNRPVLQHWLDFVLTAVPQFQPTLRGVVVPMNNCLCRQLQSALDDVVRMTSQVDEYADDSSFTATDSEFIMLLNGLERLVLLSLAVTSETTNMEEEPGTAEKSPQEGTGLLGYMTTVFSSDSVQQTAAEQLTSRSPGYRALHEGVRVLFSLWGSLSWNKTESETTKDDTLSMIYNRTRTRCRRVLEHFFRVQSTEVFESLVDYWNGQATVSKFPRDSVFELVDVLISDAQSVVHMICESISCRISGLSERSRKQAINPDLSDRVLFVFLEQYMSRLEGPVALQVWSRFLQLMKEILSGTKDFKMQMFPALRCLVVLAEKVTQTTAMEDRRVRKEVQEVFGKSLDSCVIFVGRSSDSSSWIRRTTKDASVNNGRDSPVPRSDSKFDETLNASSVSLPSADTRPGFSDEINAFLATTALPHLRRFLMDNDKVLAACTNVVYYIVNPGMKVKAKPLDVDEYVMAIIREMSRIPAALKAWKPPIVELLSDNRLFNSNPETAEQWKPIVKALYDADKTAFPELLGKVAAAPSANIFTSKEYEMLLRSLNLRRLSFVLFTGEKNHFVAQLPSIQGKLVDILRNPSTPIVQSEVYLCIRVLLCRLSPHNLTSFWPVLLTELYRLYDQTIATLPSDGSEDLQLILAASKCLDLLIALQTEEFQIHQWIFITDTVDAIYRPNDWFPDAMLDQLAEAAGSLPRATSVNGIPSPSSQQNGLIGDKPMGRPLLNDVHQIDSIRDLVPFFSSVSISTYESVYASGGNIDWEAVEKGLMDDMFDGR